MTSGRDVVPTRAPARLKPTLVAVLCPTVLGACNALFGPEIRCGSLEVIACDRRADEIQEIVRTQFPNRRAVLIEFLNGDGHANVHLDDGTEIAFGQRR